MSLNLNRRAPGSCEAFRHWGPRISRRSKVRAQNLEHQKRTSYPPPDLGFTSRVTGEGIKCLADIICRFDNVMDYQKLLSPYLAFTNDVTKIIHRRKTVTCDHFRTHIYEYKLQSTYPKFILAHKNSHLLIENSRNLTKHFKISPFFWLPFNLKNRLISPPL